MNVQTVTNYRFTPAELNPAARLPGISAFLRTRNGGDFLAATIKSHIAHYDEIVAVYNQCEDDTAEILASLAQDNPDRLRVYHYTDKVVPLGSRAHAETPGDHPESMVNYSNFALAMTRHRVAVKLDDDHLAIPDAVAAICRDWRNGRADPRHLHCFSGLNLARGADGELAVPAFDPVSGGGDIGYFEVSEKTRFFHDRRFERFDRGDLRRVFAGFFYWHLKYLKTGAGFGNYRLQDHPDSRFVRKKRAFQASDFLDLAAVRDWLKPGMASRLAARFNAKARLTCARDQAVGATFPDQDLGAALDRLSPGWRRVPGLLERQIS